MYSGGKFKMPENLLEPEKETKSIKSKHVPIVDMEPEKDTKSIKSKHVPIVDVKPEKDTKSIKSKHVPIVDVKPSVLIDPTEDLALIHIDPNKLTHTHCRRFGTEDKPYEFSDQLDMNDLRREGYDVETVPSVLYYPNVHFGQRKLMLSEIQVLLQYYKLHPNIDPIVLYVGAAPGIHLVTLSKMFPKVKFILYDGALIYKALKSHPQFVVHDKTTNPPGTPKDENDGFFTTPKCEEIAKTIDSKRLVFISDIRLFHNADMSETDVLRDMILQETWVKILTPALSLLKFRLPWNLPDVTEITYLKGDILYGIWPPSLSTESRLLVYRKDAVKNNTVTYVVKDYDEIQSYHNKYRRSFCQAWIPKIFKKYITAVNNIYCSCYDCIAELMVLHEYSLRTHTPLDKTIRIFGKGLNMKPKIEFQSIKPTQYKKTKSALV
jgi:hypothetical protein